MKKPIIYDYRRRAKSEIVLHCFVSLLFMAVALSYIYILVWSIIAACKTHSEVVLDPFSLPKKWHWEHFIEVTKLLVVNGNNFWDMLFNSVAFSVLPAFFSQLTTVWFAYICTKYSFPGSKYVYTLILVVSTLPLYGTGGGMYRLYHNLGLIDNYACILTALGSSAITVTCLYYMAYFKNLSWTYAEAAMMDGANEFKIFFRVMLPQTKPLFGAMMLTQWLGLWNDYENAMIYRPNLPTLPVGIYQFNTEMMYRARLDILFAACVIVCIPALLLFIIFNKTLTTSVSLGGIKG